jgi:hypothetical protein
VDELRNLGLLPVVSSSCDLPLASADEFRQILELERGHSILLSTAQLSPTCIAGCLAAITTGFLIAKIQSGWIMLISMSAFLTGNILLATMPVRQTYCRFS